jgi:hypothetical protein
MQMKDFGKRAWPRVEKDTWGNAHAVGTTYGYYRLYGYLI